MESISEIASDFDEKLLIIIYLKLGFKFYDDDMISDQPDRFMIREIIRESVLFKLGQEKVPTSVAILVDELTITDQQVEILATIVVERQSQKGIVIGNKGTKIKDIKYKARKELKQVFDRDINLELFVKVQEN
ncbi:hypothetical protein FQA39_LY12875 [Lamprigera yunnana]|nr:hypothetical protein FQA39_LY12875 [Lamprigera yunnana]